MREPSIRTTADLLYVRLVGTGELKRPRHVLWKNANENTQDFDAHLDDEMDVFLFAVIAHFVVVLENLNNRHVPCVNAQGRGT